MFLLSKLSGNRACKVYTHVTCMARVITDSGRKKQKHNTMKEKIISEERFARLKIHIVALTTITSFKKENAISKKINREETVQCVFLFSKSMDSKLDLKNQIKNKDHLGAIRKQTTSYCILTQLCNHHINYK